LQIYVHHFQATRRQKSRRVFSMQMQWRHGRQGFMAALPERTPI
jgi:hypothetical protein